LRRKGEEEGREKESISSRYARIGKGREEEVE
jgi:hypothetical protein